MYLICLFIIHCFADNCFNCTGGTTGLIKDALVDCAGTCGASFNDTCGICQVRNAFRNYTDCNGVCSGKAKINKCKICVGGNTGKSLTHGKWNSVFTGKFACKSQTFVILWLHFELWEGIIQRSGQQGKEVVWVIGLKFILGVDACGICGGNGTTCHDCAGVPNGGKKMDLCDKCLSPDDVNFNTACVKLGRFTPSVGYVAGGMKVMIKASGLKPYDNVTCNFLGSQKYVIFMFKCIFVR